MTESAVRMKSWEFVAFCSALGLVAAGHSAESPSPQGVQATPGPMRVVDVSRRCPRYFETSDGKPWIPIGNREPDAEDTFKKTGAGSVFVIER